MLERGCSLRTLACVVLTLVIFVHKALAEACWTEIRSRNFQIYSQGAAEGRSVLQKLELSRWMLQHVGAFRAEAEFPVRVIVFARNTEYRHYSLAGYAASYYLARRSGDTIVLTRENEDEALGHEYAHYVLHDNNGPLPPWISEGLADFYSTVKWSHGQIVLGTPVEDRRLAAQWLGQLPLSALLSTSRGDMAKLDSLQLQRFFASSWVLVHMLRLSPNYAAGFADLLAGLRSKDSPANLFEQLYGRTLSQVEGDYARYLKESRLMPQTQAIAGAPMPSDELSDVTMSRHSSRLLLADLLVKLKRYSEADPLLSLLGREAPDDPLVEEALAYRYFDRNENVDATWHFSQAVAKGSVDPRIYFHYWQLLHAFNMSRDQEIFCLERALRLKPDFAPARLAFAKAFPDARLPEISAQISLPGR